MGQAAGDAVLLKAHEAGVQAMLCCCQGRHVFWGDAAGMLPGRESHCGGGCAELRCPGQRGRGCCLGACLRVCCMHCLACFGTCAALSAQQSLSFLHTASLRLCMQALSDAGCPRAYLCLKLSCDTQQLHLCSKEESGHSMRWVLRATDISATLARVWGLS